VLSEYREALNTVDTPEAPSGEDSCLLLRLTLVSLFAQRNLGTGLYPGKDLHNCRSALLAECRQSFQAIATAIKGGYLPEREEYHQMLITTFPVDPIISYEKLVALSQMSVELASDNPDLALVLSRILLQNRAKKDLFETLRELARKQPAESVPFASAVMRAAVNVECSMNNALSQRDATVSYSEITELLKRIKDPYLAYYVLELQRVLAERFPELQQSES
jgi:hypothetical protein